jgi:predicted O-methyltransferase YrrM
LEELVDWACDPVNNRELFSAQIKVEILQLLKHIAPLRARTVLEIGTSLGGTLLLLSHVAAPDALVISLDLKHTPEQLAAFPLLVRDTQRLKLLSADSHAPATLDRLMAVLGRRPVDFLFIDGDHSFEGVKADFDTYSPLVRPGGVIALHDIIPDDMIRYGKPTLNISGEVYRYWAQLKTDFLGALEFVERPDQDAYGIGVIPWGMAVAAEVPTVP